MNLTCKFNLTRFEGYILSTVNSGYVEDMQKYFPASPDSCFKIDIVEERHTFLDFKLRSKIESALLEKQTVAF